MSVRRVHIFAEKLYVLYKTNAKKLVSEETNFLSNYLDHWAKTLIYK